MKKFFFALLVSAPVFAAEVVVMDIPAVDLRGADLIDSRFIVNEAAGTVDAKVTASETYVTCFGGPVGYPGSYYPHPGSNYPHPGSNYPYPDHYGQGGYYNRNCITSIREILSQTEEISGMTVEDKVVSYNGVICGKMGLSRVLKVPTFFMNGNCKLVEKMTRVDGERTLQVKLITK